MKSADRRAGDTLRRLCLLVIVLTGCSSGAPTNQRVGQLDPNRVLQIAVANDVQTLDPARMIGIGGEVQVARNLFGGLYRLDDDLNLKPEIADSMPSTADSQIYTIHLRHDARFSNGDPVTAADVAYSWNRSAASKELHCTLQFLIQGCLDVLNGRASSMAGVQVIDSYTLTVKTIIPIAAFPLTLDSPGNWLVDRRVIEAKGDADWWATPEGLVGTGPFRMTARMPGRRLEFAPVRSWWGGSTGVLKRIRLDVVPDRTEQVRRYLAGDFDLLGYAGQAQVPAIDPAEVARLQADRAHASEVILSPQAGTTWVQFNFSSGPFGGLTEGHEGRLAMSLAIDRAKVVKAACGKVDLCQAATGGLISKGLRGHLGDGADTSAIFDPTAARATYEKWDPNHTRLAGLRYVYNSTPQNDAVAESLRAQWLQNLGVDVVLRPLDLASFADQRSRGAFALYRFEFDVTLDHPGQWYGGLFVNSPSGCGCGFTDPEFETLFRKDFPIRYELAASDYQTIGRLLIEDAVYAALFYELRVYLVKPYLRGVGGNALYDYAWTSARILAR